MAGFKTRPTTLVVACVLAVLFGVDGVPAFAGQDNDREPSAMQAPPGPDFLLGRPRASVGLRGNWLFNRAGSDIFDFVTEQLTLEKSAFNGPTIGGELAVAINDRLDVVGAVDLANSSNKSEYRDFIDNSGLPIEQTTTLSQARITGSVKLSLLSKGRSVSRYAYIPRSVRPYVGAGGGAVKYSFEQTGDFIDFVDNGVFTSTFTSDGWAPTAHAFGGVDVAVHRHLFVSFEGRYNWASGELSQKFLGFDPIDLSGFQFGAGFHVAF